MLGIVRRSDRDRRCRRPARALVGLAAVLLSLGVAASAGAASRASGNSKAIAIARESADAYTQIPAETFSESGFIEMTDQEGSSSYFHFTWDQPKLRHGWSWAAEHSVVALAQGHVVWWSDELTPPPCTAVGACHQIPVEMVGDSSGAYWAFGTPGNHTCFGRLNPDTPFVVGAVVDQVVGHFSAPVSGPGTVQLTYTYPLGKRVTAKETDTLSAQTKLVKSVHAVLTGGHTIQASLSYPARTPREPHVNSCAG